MPKPYSTTFSKLQFQDLILLTFTIIHHLLSFMIDYCSIGLLSLVISLLFLSVFRFIAHWMLLVHLVAKWILPSRIGVIKFNLIIHCYHFQVCLVHYLLILV